MGAWTILRVEIERSANGGVSRQGPTHRRAWNFESCKDATVSLDTDVNGRQDAFNPAELFLAAIAACMIKGIERVMLKFDIRGVEVHLRGVRQDSPPKMTSIDYELIVDTDEDDHRFDLLLMSGNTAQFLTPWRPQRDFRALSGERYESPSRAPRESSR
jgi:uncharacterized OsmC-like protein